MKPNRINMSSACLKWLSLSMLLASASAAHADCTGSGTAWSCSAGTTSAQISAALGSATDGSTLTFKAGSYSWSGFVSFSNSKGASLVCESAGACVVTAGGTLGMNGNLSGYNSKLYRVSGFKFQNGGTGPTLWFYGPGTLAKLRIDHNTFTSYADSATVMILGEVSTVATFNGVIDHNTLSNSSNMMLVNVIGATAPAVASLRGSANNLFIEDNTFTFTNLTNGGQGCIDGWGGDAIVFRHNTTTNCLVTQHGVLHSGGPWNTEVYGNTLKVDSGAGPFADGYRLFHHQGSGEFIAFNNVFTAASGKSGSAIGMTHYRSASPSAAGYDASLGRCDGTSTIDGNRSGKMGYPCWRQPGRDGTAKLQPMYVWNNRWSDTGGKIDMDVENPWAATNPSVDDHIASNRDYYNAVSASAQTSTSSPFNGTSGMGFGTLANRPSTCTTNASEAGGGVGYFAVDQGTQGTLYRCSATNTWTVHYTPYTYPHPLVSGVAAAPLSAPTNLKIQ
jgi:hypothetical protein